MRHLVGAVQMTSGPVLEQNLQKARELISRAAARGARVVVLPENFALFSPDEESKRAAAEVVPLGPDRGHRGPILSAMAQTARETGATLILGGMPERTTPWGPQARIYNSCVAVGSDGEVLAVYRKIHLFDVAIPDGATYQESRMVAPGEGPVLVDTGIGPIGLSVCYDLRFPELYRALVQRGARIVVVPAAFTLHTGRDHWHVLLRARAIENLVYVVAAAQVGQNDDKRVTYGHSLVVDPWGTVIADAPDGEGVVVAEVDPERQDRLRRELPALGHRRL